MSAPGKPRSLTLRILRSAPGAHVEPQWQDFAVEEAEGMTLFIALNEIRQNLDPSLQFDFVCRAGICGSCGMLSDATAPRTSMSGAAPPTSIARVCWARRLRGRTANAASNQPATAAAPMAPEQIMITRR